MATTVANRIYPYQYDSLPGERFFRLLSLATEQPVNGPIRLSLRTHDLIETPLPCYTALSYTWGVEPDRTVPVLVDGALLKITSALAEALRHLIHLRNEHTIKDSLWWIDMICINQSNLKERCQQVTIMRNIFRGAELVIAWLGPETEGSRALFRSSHNQKSRPNRLPGSARIESASDEVFQPRDWVAALFRRRYWSRIWILQELCVAKEILLVCGHDVLPWTLFQAQIVEYPSLRSGRYWENPIGRLSVSDFSVLVPYSIVNMRDRHGAETLSLDALLTLSSQCEQTDPRDRVYALFGIVDDGSAEQLIPDYSLSPCEVYSRAIRFMYNRSKEPEAIKKIVQRCPHDLLEDKDGARLECRGSDCGSWWCCLDVALVGS